MANEMRTFRLVDRSRPAVRLFRESDLDHSVFAGFAGEELGEALVFGELDGRAAIARAGELVIGVSPQNSGFLNDLGLVEIWFDPAGRFGVYRSAYLPIAEILALLANDPRIRFAEPNFIDGTQNFSVQMDGEDGDDVPPPAHCWNHSLVEAGDPVRPSDGQGVVVAVVDGLMDPDHRWLKSAYACDPRTLQFGQALNVVDHGMGVASIVCGTRLSSDGKPIALAPAAKLLPVAIDISSGSSYADRARAIFQLSSARAAGGIQIGDHYLGLDRLIVNCSWQLRSYLDLAATTEAFAALAASGAICVCSAGNEGDEKPHFPSDYPGVISVAAVRSDLARPPFSNFGTKIDYCAPGGDGAPRDVNDIYCAGNNSGYRFAFGTSFAAPHVSGALAAIWSRNPALDAAALIALVNKHHVLAIAFAEPAVQNKMGRGIPILASSA
jgi:thermitase